MNPIRPAYTSKQFLGLLLGPLGFIVILFLIHPEGLSDQGRAVLAVTFWIATWWITEAAPIELTSLLPILLFPLSGGLDLKSTTAAYAHPMIFLFMGGFIIALAIERWNLHRRIALRIVGAIGTNTRTLVLGFMLATAFLSMWISNTATALMMLPIGTAIIRQYYALTGDHTSGSPSFSKALLLSIAYSASIGGMATLIGTPPNLVFAAVVKETLGQEITFSQWIIFGLPFSISLLLVCWLYLTRIAYPLADRPIPGGKEEIQHQLKALGSLGKEEKWVLAIFSLTAFAWISRSFLLNYFIPELTDTHIALAGAVLLFLIPAPSEKGERLIDWNTAQKLPWGILLLFGGGLSLAAGFSHSGLAAWIGSQMSLLDGVALLIIILVVTTLVNFLTEITSNLATASVILPILASLAIAMSVHPYGLMVAAILAASCAFMLPVATPPNAVIFGSNMVSMNDMIRAGFRMNLLSVVLIVLYVWWVLPEMWDIQLDMLPASMGAG